MLFDVGERLSESPYVEKVWRSQCINAGTFSSVAISNWEIVVTKDLHDEHKSYITVRGPETKATSAECPQGHESFGIQFKLGAFMPHLPVSNLVDNSVNLPEAAFKSFWFYGSTWEFPTFDNADSFVERLVRDGLLVYEPIVEVALQNQVPDISLRSVQRRFLRATGLTQGAVAQIERARYAVSLLEQGVSILDVVDLAGYTDQPHLTKSLKRFIGHTPATIHGINRSI